MPGDAQRIGNHLQKLYASLRTDEGVEPFEGRAEALAQARQEAHEVNEYFAEINFCRFPFAFLSSKDTGRTDDGARIVVQKTLTAGQGGDFFWKVTPSKEHGMPGPFDRKVWRAIEKLLYERTLARGDQLSNPQSVPPTAILRELRISEGGSGVAAVTAAMERLRGAEIDCSGINGTGTGKSRRLRKARGRIFSPITEIGWAGEVDHRSGRRFASTTIWLSDVYLESFNGGNVRPIDWDLWLSLDRPLSQRLYEILESKFFGLRHSKYVVFQYSELCQLLPMRRQAYRSLAMRNLDRAHRDMKQVAVRRTSGQVEQVTLLQDPDWVWDGDDAVIKYYPSPAYLERLQARKTFSARAAPQMDVRAFEMAKKLGDSRSLTFYQLIYARVDPEIIQIAYTQTRMAEQGGRLRRRPAAYFVATLSQELRKRGLAVPFTERGPQ